MGGLAAPDLKQTRPVPAQGPPDSAMNLARGTRSEMLLAWALQERWRDEVVHRMDHVGRAGSHCRSRECPGTGAIWCRWAALRGCVRRRGTQCGDASG